MIVGFRDTSFWLHTAPLPAGRGGLRVIRETGMPGWKVR